MRAFHVGDVLTESLPKADVVLCRDCLVHFSARNVRRAVANIIRSGSTYLLTTTFPRRHSNRTIVTGDWRPLNLCAAPFNFPQPLQVISEEHPEPYADKSLGLWRISDLPR